MDGRFDHARIRRGGRLGKKTELVHNGDATVH